MFTQEHQVTAAVRKPRPEFASLAPQNKWGSSGIRVGNLRGKHGWKPHVNWLSGVSQVA